MTYDQHRMINIEHPATQQAESLALPRLSSQAQGCDHIQAKGCQHLAGERRCLYTNEHTPARSLMPRPIRRLQETLFAPWERADHFLQIWLTFQAY